MTVIQRAARIGAAAIFLAATGACANNSLGNVLGGVLGGGSQEISGSVQGVDSRSQQVFVQQLQTRAMPNVSAVERVGDYHTPSGGTMVYYAVDASGQSVGYIVYLGHDGKVLKIE